jgi:hypothetical protein
VPGADSSAYLGELRLDLERLDPADLALATASARPKIRRAFRRLAAMSRDLP